MSETTETTPSGDRILLRARFDPRLQVYFLFQSALVLFFTFIAIPFLPFWLLGIGQYVHRRQFESMESELTERTLNIRKGFLVRTQKNVPLDKITDLAVSEGPILRKLGLCSLRVETAGGGGGGGTMGQAYLPGVIDAIAFRDAVMKQRDVVVGAAGNRPTPAAEAEGATLTDVRDALVRIERLLDARLNEKS